jgi:hypothetical protein
MTMSQHAQQQQEASAARTRSFALPGILAFVVFVAIVYIQFSLVLGKFGFFAELPLAIVFYYCWAWHRRLAAKADVLEKATR